MKMALYHPWVYLRGGIERTLLELVTRSRHQWTLFTSRYEPNDTFPEFRDIDIVQMGKVSVRRSMLPVARACLDLALRRREWRGYDALMVSCDGIGNLATLRSRDVPLICLCHTPLKVAYDRRTRERWISLMRPRLYTRAAVQLFAAVDRTLWRRYQRIFCVSREVESRLAAAGIATAGRTKIVHPGVDVDRLSPSGRREPFLLMPGRIMWTKNIELGIEAFVQMKRDVLAAEPFRLVIAGMVDEKSRPYLRHLKDMTSSRTDVEFVVSPSDDDLFDLYDRCHTVLFTPPNEDWGIVPLEAMSFAKPVVSVASGGPRESVVEGETGFLRPADATRFAEAIGRLVESDALYERMSGAARQRALEFTWGRFTEKIDSYLDTLSGAGPAWREPPLRTR